MKKLIFFLIIITAFTFKVKAGQSAEEILQGVTDLYTSLKTYKDNTEVIMSLTSLGIENRVSYLSDIFIKRPNKFVIKSRSEMLGRTLISDGEVMWLHLPLMKKYTKITAPENLEETLAANIENLETIGSEQFLLFLFLNKENKFLSDLEITANIYGEEIIDGSLTDIIEVKDKTLSMRLWVNRENNFITKILLDATPIISKQQIEMGIEPSEIKMEYIEIHSNISIDEKISDDVFRFVPPENSSMVDNISELDDQSPDYPYLGKKFIDFELKSVNRKGKIKLSDHVKNIILLIFFDSKQERSTNVVKNIQRIYENYKGEKLMVVGIARKGNEKELKRFIKRNKIKFAVLIDKENNVTNSYGVITYPSLFIISVTGFIRQIYTGYFAGLEERIAEDLNLLLNKAGVIKYEMPSKKTKGLQRLWNIPVKATGLSVNGEITAINTSGNMHILSPQGSVKKIIKLDNTVHKILSVDLDNDNNADYIVYRKGGRDVVALNSNGGELWKIKIEPGINDIEAGNILGDEYPEIGIGISGLEGVRIIDHEGKIIWRSTGVINALQIGIGNITGDEFKEVAVVSNDGKIYVFNHKGDLINTIKPQIYANYVKIIEPVEGDTGILISGSSGDSEILKVLNTEGKVRWEVILGDAENSCVKDVKVHPFSNFIAVSTLDGQVFVFDSIGNIIAYIQEQGINILIGWLSMDTGQCNLITAGIESGISNYILIESE